MQITSAEQNNLRAAWIRETRNGRGILQKDLAKAIKKTNKYISRIENAETWILSSVLEEIELVLRAKCNVHYT